MDGRTDGIGTREDRKATVPTSQSKMTGITVNEIAVDSAFNHLKHIEGGGIQTDFRAALLYPEATNPCLGRVSVELQSHNLDPAPLRTCILIKLRLH
jgi:hypothetical protein